MSKKCATKTKREKKVVEKSAEIEKLESSIKTLDNQKMVISDQNLASDVKKYKCSDIKKETNFLLDPLLGKYLNMKSTRIAMDGDLSGLNENIYISDRLELQKAFIKFAISKKMVS